MRQIKFRAWDKNHGCMHYSDNCTLDWLFDLPKRHGGSVMQFTGLKDKKGKEIFEGDIIKRKDSRFYYSIHWGKTSFGVSEHRDSGKFSSDFRYHWDGNELGEVIGNIYENPELLNKN